MSHGFVPDARVAVLPSTCHLYLGDCLNIMPLMVPKNVAMIFADLPYTTAKRRVTGNRWDSPFPLERFWQTTYQIAQPKSVFALTATQPFASSVVCSNDKAFRYDLIWQKSHFGGFLNANRQPLRSHESILIFYKSAPIYNPQKIIGVPYRKSGICGLSNPTGGGPRHMVHINEGTRHPGSVLLCANGNNKSLHPTQKPVALLEWLIKTYTNPGDTVLDPVFGSATTGVACARLGRHFIGIEKDPEYFRIGRERVDAERAKLGLQPCEVQT